LAATVAFVGCGRAPDPWREVSGGPTKVVASFPPLYCFTKSVAGPDAAVLCLLETTGPHDFHPDRQDALKLSKADLFLVNGLGLDDWVPGLVRDAHNTGLKVIPVGDAIPKKLLLERDEDEDKDEHKHGHDGHEHHGEHDPHVWLGVPQAVALVGRIRDVLKEQDKLHAAGFDKRAADYTAELRKLQDYGRKALAGKKNKKLVATHDSLRYFCKSFGLELVGSIQPQAGVEADAGQLRELTKLCQKEHVRVIATEPQFSRATAETLGRQLRSRGLQVRIVEVDPLETADPPLEPGYYVRKMRENLDNLAKSLE
jgi:ABC-type Zn uptake system ZnuABC Zn-binding protein ZnuA